MKELKDIKDDEWVFTIKKGWTNETSVRSVVTSPRNEIVLIVDDIIYDETGTVPGDKHPSAWTYDPFNNTQPPCEFKRGEVAVFSDASDYSEKFYGPFLEMGVGCYRDRHGQYWRYARKLTKEERGEEG